MTVCFQVEIKSAMAIGNLQSADAAALCTSFVFTYSFVMPNSNSEFKLLSPERRIRRPSGRLWNPSADVYRSPDGWIVKLDLAGVSSDDLEIELRDKLLTIRGCRRDTHYCDRYIYHQMEITYSRFEKQIEFPARIEGASVLRDYSDGFLIIQLRRE